MKISLIVAVADNGVIGRDQGLPWRLPSDLKRFRKLTIGKPVIMGRKTWESIGRPLPDRVNIVVSKDPEFAAEGAIVAPSIVEALAEAEEEEEVMIIGGASLYEQLMERADNLYLTRVHAELEGDTFFPHIEEEDWQEKSSKRYEKDEKNEYAFTFIHLEKGETLVRISRRTAASFPVIST